MENEIKILENNCIHDVDKAFNEYLLMDITDAGEVEDIIDDSYWYLFWWSNAYEINWRINFMLDNDYPPDLLLRAIIVKRAIDENIVKYGDKDQIRKELDLGGKTQVSFILNVNVKVDRLNDFLSNFYHILINEGLTDTEFSDFTTNFVKGDTIIPINWLGKQNYLLGLIKFLIRKKIILLPPNRTISNVVLTHFTRSHKKFNKRSVEVMLTHVEETDQLYLNFSDLSKYTKD